MNRRVDQDLPADEDSSQGQGSNSVRVVIVFFLATLVLLLAMGVYWLFIRVEPAQSAGSPQLPDGPVLSLIASG